MNNQNEEYLNEFSEDTAPEEYSGDDQQDAHADADDNQDMPEQVDDGLFFVSVDGDGIGREVGSAILSDDIQKLHEISQAINHGQNLMMDWAENNGGQVISSGGDEGIFHVPASALDSLEDLRQQYLETVGVTLTVGIGGQPSESGKALLYGKLNGKDQINHFHPEMDDFLMEAHQHADSGEGSEEEKKQDEQYLSDMFDDSSDTESLQDYSDETDGEYHHFDETQGSSDLNPHEADQAAQALGEAGIEEGSDEGQDEDLKDAMKDEMSQPDSDFSLKQKLGEVLESFKMDKPILEQMSSENPEMYAEVVQLLQQMISVAKMLSNQSTPIDSAAAPIEQESNVADPAVGKQIP